MKKTILLFSFLVCFAILPIFSFAKEESGASVSATIDLQKVSNEYFSKNDYDGFYDSVKAFLKKNKKSASGYYYLALARMSQIAYWQKSKDWEGVYDKADNYKKDITENLKIAQKYIKNDPVLFCDIKFLQWQSARLDASEDLLELFQDFLASLKELAPSTENLDKIKKRGDELSSLEDKSMARRIYEIYVEKITGSSLSKDEVKAKGQEFLEAGNVYLAKALFENYLSQLKGDEDLQAKETVLIADKFIHTGFKEGVDPVYAEALYVQAADKNKTVFDSDSLYRRAYNLERLKEFKSAYDLYKDLIARFSDTALLNEINFRLGVLSAYALKDIDTASAYFLKISEDAAKGPHTLSALYQLGLLNQWKEEKERAKGFYQALLEAAQAVGVDMTKNELVLMAQERLKEIEDAKDIKHGLKIFLDGVLKTDKEPNLSFVVDLTAHPAKAFSNEAVKLIVTTSNPQTGCMMPSYSYEWSGEVGSMSNIPNSPELTTSYAEPGVKVTHVAVIGAQGLDGVGFEITQIESK